MSDSKKLKLIKQIIADVRNLDCMPMKAINKIEDVLEGIDDQTKGEERL